jgi:prepilin-type N-terminal cleavage/methylation domain-containing protein
VLRIFSALKRKDKGFTLVELMAVVVILGILTAFAVPKVLNSISKAKEKTDNANFTTLQRTVNRVYAEEGLFPQTLNELIDKGYMENVPEDPVGNSPYGYDKNTGKVTHSGH